MAVLETSSFIGNGNTDFDLGKTNSKSVSKLQQDTDAEYWTSTTGYHIERLLAFADYPAAKARLYLDFYNNTLCPLMGSAPVKDSPEGKRSCLTTDGTPIEYSLSFESTTTAPTVRLSLEPDATSADLLSTLRGRDLAGILATHQDCKAVEINTWATELLKLFQLPKLSTVESEKLLARVEHRSQLTFGFDLTRDVDQMNAKIYFNPCMKAALTGQTRWQVVDQAICQVVQADGNIGLQTSILGQLSLLRDHIEAYPSEVQDSVRYLSMDLARSSDSRVKVYVRCPAQDFDGVWDFLTMKGMITFSDDHRLAIQDLYCFVRGEQFRQASANETAERVETSTSTSDFMQSALRTAPFKKVNICYFVLKQGQPTPTSKLFIRVQQPFVDSDATVARGLEAWFRRWNWLSHDGNWDYVGLLRDMIPHRDLQADTGLHSWIAVSVKNGKLTVESYLTPELYKQLE